MISFGRLLLGLVAPVLLVLALFVPADVVVRVEPIDWPARYQDARRDARGEGSSLHSLARSFADVPDTLQAYVDDTTRDRLVLVEGEAWQRLADGVLRASEAAAAKDAEWRWRLGRRGSLYEGDVFFGADEPPVRDLARRGRELVATRGAFAYVAVADAAGARRHLGLTLLAFGDAFRAAPLRLLFPWRRSWPLALAAAAALHLLVLRPKLPRRVAATAGVCAACTAPAAPGAAFCASCGARVENPQPPPPPLPLAWDARIPLLANPFFLGDALRLVAIVAAVMLALMGAITLAGGGGSSAFLSLVTMTSLVLLALVLLGAGVTLVLDRVGHSERVLIDNRGLVVSTSRAARRIAQAAAVANVVGGAVTGRPGNVGLGLVTATDLDRFVGWADVRRVELYPSVLVIVVREAWPTPHRLYCPDAETYRQALSAICERVLANGGTLSRRRGIPSRLFAGAVAAILLGSFAFLLLA